MMSEDEDDQDGFEAVEHQAQLAEQRLVETLFNYLDQFETVDRRLDTLEKVIDETCGEVEDTTELHEDWGALLDAHARFTGEVEAQREQMRVLIIDATRTLGRFYAKRDEMQSLRDADRVHPDADGEVRTLRPEVDNGGNR